MTQAISVYIGKAISGPEFPPEYDFELGTTEVHD